MAKNKRKISQSQRDKTNILRAKILKEAGIISKRANLHSGRYISPGVLKKVREYGASADLDYKAYKVTRATAQAAKERGFQVVAGNKVIGPKNATFRNRLAKGELTGVRPVKGGMMEEVILPHTVMDMRSLMEQLSDGIDTLKAPGEYFAFKYHGNESYRAFPNTQSLLEYLRHYRGLTDIAGAKPEELQEEFANFTVFRLHPNSQSQNIRGPARRREDKRRARMEAIARGEYVAPARKGKSRSLYDMPERMANKIRTKSKARMAEKRAAMSEAEIQQYRELNAKRMREARARRKK